MKSAMVSVLVRDLGKDIKSIKNDYNAGLISTYKSDMLKQAYRSACSLAAALDALAGKERTGG